MTKDEAKEIFDAALEWAAAAVRYSDVKQQEQSFLALVNSMIVDTKMDDQKNLCGFVREIMKSWLTGDVERGELQDLAIKYGLIKLKDPPPEKPCFYDCLCTEVYDFEDFANGIVECYEKTELLREL